MTIFGIQAVKNLTNMFGFLCAKHSKMGNRMNIKKIYFDMDGELADIGRGIIELCGIETMDQLTSSEEDNLNI